MRQIETYSLRQVADLTGLSEFTLRGWEGRYQAFKPDRTDTGRRLYSKKDLKRAFLLRELTRLGRRIGDVAHMSNVNLEKELNHSSSQVSALRAQSVDCADSILRLVFLHNWDELKNTLEGLLARRSPLSAIEKVILPILSQLGYYTGSGQLSVAQEHVLSSLIKEQLYMLLLKVSKIKTKSNRFSVLVATPEGDHHEIGILIAHVMFTAAGARSLFIGPNTPKKDLCETALRFGATHILLAATVTRREGAQDEMFSYVHYLDQNLPKSVSLWVGGRTFEKLSFSLNRSSRCFLSLQELPNAIQESLKFYRGEK